MSTVSPREEQMLVSHPKRQIQQPTCFEIAEKSSTVKNKFWTNWFWMSDLIDRDFAPLVILKSNHLFLSYLM